MTEGGCERAVEPGDHLYLIDGSGYIFRAYHALPPLTRKSDGLPTGAVAGFCNMLWKLLEDTKAGDKPSHLAVIFDAGRESFRNAFFPDYKANRSETPEDLIPQFPLVRDATRAFGVPAIDKMGFEADDLIATYARLGREAGARVTIISSDKDLMQLVVDGKVEMLDTMKNRRIGPAEVIERFGVAPDKVIDVQALAGDSTDNVPGVPGIGVKIAAELIRQYGDLETLLARAGEIKQPKRRQSLLDNAEKARLSERLVRLDQHVPIDTGLADFGVCEPDPATLLSFFKTMELNTLGKRAAAKLGVENLDALSPAGPKTPSTESPDSAPAPAATNDEGGTPGMMTNGALRALAFDLARYETLTDVPALERWIAQIHEQGRVAIHLMTSGMDDPGAQLIGVGLAVEPGVACYIPLGHQGSGGLDLGGGPKQLSENQVLAQLKAVLESDAILKIGHDLKRAARIFSTHSVALAALDDVMLLSYVHEAGLHGHGIDELSELHLGHTPTALQDLTGKGRDRLDFSHVALGDAAAFAAERADVILRLQGHLRPALIAARRVAVYETLERPLVPILADMERAGILIDPDILARLSNDFAQGMARLEKELHQLAGEAFNLGSPKQLGEILFDKLSLPGGRRTRTGAWSTDADVLEELAAQGHDIPSRILAWRQLAKLKSTYTDALPQHIDSKTGRVHTNFALAATTTGRISSNDPNLQNIPIRTEEGRTIRRAFVAPAGRCLISADYSQIELRLLAHIADVPALSKAFADGQDIHAMTASEIFGVPVKGMPAETRRRAKAINFGIIYGISAFGLANQLGIARGEADSYIKKYFERFPGIRDYMEETRKFVREHGYVETIFGRRIHVRDAKAGNAAHRAFGERQAINAPIQGSASDIIRRAMIRLPAALAESATKAQLLLQVHDELVIEASTAGADAVCRIARDVMEKAPLPALQLKVPLVVDARAGSNWDQAH